MQAWDDFLAQLDADLGKETVDLWVRPLKVLRFDAANLYLEAKEAFHISWFEEHIRPRIKKGLLNNNFRPIHVHLVKEEAQKEKESRPFQKISSSSLNPEMRLETFLVTPSNQITYQVISDSEFNPIFLYGPKGSGKTHLLTAIAQKKEEKGQKIFFVSASTFTDHVVTAMRLGNMQEFRRTYREIDALFVDDIHIFSRKTSTQEEFFHTFNALQSVGKQIFLTANLPPSQLVDIEPRLISRFEWGITLSLEKIDPLLILKEKCTLWDFPLSEELLSYLLRKFPSDPLLALQALFLRKDASHLSLTEKGAEILLKDLILEEEKKALTPDKILKSVADHFSVTTEDILGKSQVKEIAFPRQFAMYLCRERLKMPFQKIGQLFGRDHSTVMTSVKQIEKGVGEKKEVKALLDRFVDLLK